MAVLKRAVVAIVFVSCGAAAASAASGAPAASPRIYEVGALTPDRYVVLRHLWAESWRSAFWVPTHGEPAAAAEALQAEAASFGADGIVNLHCLNDRGGWTSRADAFFCYGNAIRLK